MFILSTAGFFDFDEEDDDDDEVDPAFLLAAALAGVLTMSKLNTTPTITVQQKIKNMLGNCFIVCDGGCYS